MTWEFDPKLNLTQSQKDRIAAAEQALIDGLEAHEKLREFWEPGEWVGTRSSGFDQLTEVRKLDLDIRTYVLAVLNVLAEVALSAPTTAEVRAYIQNGATALLKDAYARVDSRDAPFLDASSIDRLVENACYALIQLATSRHDFLRNPKSRPGTVVESNLRYEKYPGVKYHWTKKPVTVKSAEEELALGGGWGDLEDFAPYQALRLAPVDQQQVTKWVDSWPVAGLTEEQRRRIKAKLLRADSLFWSAPEKESADLSAMKLAFDGVARVLFDAGVLTEEHLSKEIPMLVWDTAIAGGWYREASEVPKKIFPERLGHYFVWRDDTKDWNGLFRAETAKWLAELLDRSQLDNGVASEGRANQDVSPEIEGADRKRVSPVVESKTTHPASTEPTIRPPEWDVEFNPANSPLYWQRFRLDKSSQNSKFLLRVPDSLANFSIPAPYTNRDIVIKLAEDAKIAIESLDATLSEPVFALGSQVIHGRVGDEIDQIARRYPNMRWWVSDRGLNMAVLSAEELLGTRLTRLVAERATRRRAVVMPILEEKGWKPGRLVTDAGVGKNTVYRYLDGTRSGISAPNRQAIADALGIKLEELPE